MDRDEEAARNKALYALRRPEDFAPWETKYPDGCKLAEAIYALTLPGWRKSVADFLADMAVGLFSERRPAMQDHFWRHIVYRLQAGELVMRGHRGGDPLEDVAPNMLDETEPDFAANCVTCCGVLFRGVRILPADAAEAPQEERDASKTPKQSTRDWMIQNVTAYRSGQRDDAEKRCRKALGVKNPEAREGWNALPVDIKGKSRKPSK